MAESSAEPIIDARIDKSAWQASLNLRFALVENASKLVEREHNGPLRVQKALYPEGPSVCHVIIVHPPGGVVGGDRLKIDVQVDEAARALLTSPGASKWYRANGKQSHQSNHFVVADDASLEWLPQETIFYDQAQVASSLKVDLGANSRFISCEIFCFGRSSSGEKFQSGRVRQHLEVRQEGRLLWLEQGSLDPERGDLQSGLGLRQKSVCACLLAVGQQLAPDQLQALRDALGALIESGVVTADDDVGVTQIKSLVVVRYLGNRSEAARHVMLVAWRYLRPRVLGLEAQELRIWNT